MLRFKSIGEPDDEPEDETTPEFRRELEIARLDDEAYLGAISDASPETADSVEDSSSGQERAARAERDLRVRLRAKLGMVARKDAAFSTASDMARRLGLDPSFDLPAHAQGADSEQAGGERADRPTRPHHADNVVQTLLFEEDLERTLASVREHTRLSISESGVNPLFCVFGFLEWFEDDASESAMHAPLMLYPLEIDYDIVRGKRKHFVASAGDGAQTNVALAERLRRDFGISLPEISTDETPESYMSRVAEIVAPMKRWRVRRWMTLGLFSFARISMYHDLDRDRWVGEHALDANPILTRLIAGGGCAVPPSQEGTGPERSPSELELPIIADADSSQAEAIRRALAGQSMVIEGPPGTGKSQTITNIIAGALAGGKRILFVAEKMAALSVVKKRLDDAGLGAFCLELHSTKSSRREVFGAFARRLAIRPEPGVDRDLRTTLEHLGTQSEALESCVSALGAPAGKLSCSTHGLLWKCTAARARTDWLPPAIDGVVVPEVESLTDADVGRILSVADRVDRAWAGLTREFRSMERCPWSGVAVPELDAIRAADVSRLMSAFAESAARAAELADELRSLSGCDTRSVSQLESIACVVELPPVPSGMRSAVIGDASNATEPVNALIAEFVEITGISADRARTIAGERLIIDAIDAACAASDAVIASRTEPLVAQSAEGPLERFRREAARLNEERAQLGSEFAIEGLDVQALRAHARSLRGAPALPWLSPAWWRARAHFKGIRKGTGSMPREAQAAALERLADHSEAWSRLEQDSEARALLGPAFRGVQTDFDAAMSVVQWASRVRSIAHDPTGLLVVDLLLRGSAERVRAIQLLAREPALERLRAGVAFVRAVEASPLPPELRGWMLETDVSARAASLVRIAGGVREATPSWRAAFTPVERSTRVDPVAWVGAGPTVFDASPRALAARSAACAADPESLQTLCDALRARADAESESIGPVIDVVSSVRPALNGLADAAARAIYQSLARSLIANSPALQSFSGERHESNRERFCTLDRRLLALRQRQISSGLARSRIDAGSDSGPKKQWTGLALVEHVAATPRSPTSLRDVLDRAGSAVQQLLPCFMMSPLSVAQYLKPGSMAFDLVIMDEASQMRPEDAIGAIARGAQVVIVGDPKQLPPTAFFMGSDASPDAESEGSAADEQSILDQGMATLRPIRRLTWHYRSRHASLIAYSNSEFYDNELIVFPSPHHESEDFGVRYERVEGGVYSGRGLNPNEARRVAEAAVSYALRHPDRSLGLVALNQPQTERISLEIDRLASEHPEFEAWRKERDGTLEPFFVKNLENVQGDERDAIFISTVYGRDERGAFFQRFGPINNAGGHRRLNVLYTRSKCQTVVFSSMDPSDIKANEGSSWGARALKGYLAFAKSGIIEAGIGSSDAPRSVNSEFETSVSRVLQEAGFDAATRVGVGGSCIDIAVRHPSRSGEFVLGIECDGESYHSRESARDRDRLRQEVLERLGWKIHRIWSLDWFKSPGRDRDKLIRAVKSAIASSEAS